MSEFDVGIDCSTLERSRTGTITGELAVRVEGEWFPERQWNDFPVVVLEWWLAALLDLRAADSVDLRFMDGPFLVRLSPQHQSMFRLEGVEDGQIRRVNVATEVSIRQVYDSIIRAAQLVDKACTERGWSSDDVRRLQSTLHKAVGDAPSLFDSV
ncbi:MAG: hypothetical protein H7A04_16095 [Pseudomonadales bacterium]|nr:hypothetical protein [Pseudomonadales bacterium]